MRIGEKQRWGLEAVGILLLILTIRFVFIGDSEFDGGWGTLSLILSSAMGYGFLAFGFALKSERLGLIMATLWISSPAVLLQGEVGAVFLVPAVLSLAGLTFLLHIRTLPYAPIVSIVIFICLLSLYFNWEPQATTLLSQLNIPWKARIVLTGWITLAIGTICLRFFFRRWSTEWFAELRNKKGQSKSAVTSVHYWLFAVGIGTLGIMLIWRPSLQILVLALVMLGTAMVIDQSAIWFARKEKEKPGSELLLTRPLITRHAILLTFAAATLQVGLSILLR